MSDVTALLRDKLVAIDAELGVLTEQPQDAGAIQFGKRAGDATNIAAEQLSRVATHEQLLALRAEVERALAKLDDGSYGKCETCGEPITEARLEAMPAARFCINHA